MSILEVRQLCKFYRAGSAAEVRALQDITPEVPAGSFTLLTGPSGSGKTTLLALLGCLERPTRGQVFFAGRGVIALLQEAHREGKTIVASSHDPRMAALATRVCELAAGRLLAVRDVSA